MLFDQREGRRITEALWLLVYGVVALINGLVNQDPFTGGMYDASKDVSYSPIIIPLSFSRLVRVPSESKQIWKSIFIFRIGINPYTPISSLISGLFQVSTSLPSIAM